VEPPPSPLPWKVDGLLILAADGTVIASVATHAPVSLRQLKVNAEVIVEAVNRGRAREEGNEQD
jgi:hypothetical protein